MTPCYVTRDRVTEALATLPRSTLDDLTRAVHDARATQAEHLKSALDGALKIAPKPLRGVLRKLLIG